MMKAIVLTKDKSTLVSDEDHEYLLQWEWCFDKKGYARHTVNSEHRNLSLHRLVMERMLEGPIPTGYEVDHIDRNGLNNQRENLRLATRSENSRNSRGRQGSSQYKGVTWHKDKRQWQAKIKIDYKTIHLGYFQNERDAALAYDAKARASLGEFAFLNFSDE